MLQPIDSGSWQLFSANCIKNSEASANGTALLASTLNRSTKECHHHDTLREAVELGPLSTFLKCDGVHHPF